MVFLPVEALFSKFVTSNGTDEEIKESCSAKVLEQLQILIKSYKAAKGPTESLEFELIELDKDKCLVEYTDVQDRVLNYIKPTHNWKPTIAKIEKISNPSLEKKFNLAKKRCTEKYTAQKFHGTGKGGIENIPREGFKIPPYSPGKQPMFGYGIYFATDSSKSAQKIYTKGTNKLLLCDVLLGNAKTVLKADHSLTLAKIRAEGFDSVLAPRDSKSTGGVLYDEFVIYDPDQALPRYIIHFESSQNSSPSPSSANSDCDEDNAAISPDETELQPRARVEGLRPFIVMYIS